MLPPTVAPGCLPLQGRLEGRRHARSNRPRSTVIVTADGDARCRVKEEG
ncbi:Hypothetical protein A7982_11825 [Minicystis rosea]|nr:Hypothetical protein A7982_11825 [Minicystis rosea]